MLNRDDIKLEKLNEIYQRADEADKKLFAEMRSNILLVSNEHYRKTAGKLERGLEAQGVDKSKRIRLTKNHLQKITSDIKDMFMSHVTNMKPVPRNDSELSDQKSAELHNSVWEWSQEKIHWDVFVDRTVNGFVDVGEAAAKHYYDPNQGELVGYEQLVDKETGKPVFKDASGNQTLDSASITMDSGGFDEFGNELPPIQNQIPNSPVPDETKPKFSGKLCIEKLYPFNLLRAPSCDSMEASPYLIYRHMMDVNEARKKFGQGDKEIEEKIVESGNRTMKVFDALTGDYSDAKGQVMIREFYIRQCMTFPKGYYVIATDTVILLEGELPFGEAGEIAFPIKHGGYDIIETSPRFAAPIRPLRQPQGEINRIGSSMAEAQMIHGADKLILKGGSTYSKGTDMPGWRVLQVTGEAPMILPGRAGEQFTQPLDKAISELYMLAKLPENDISAAQVTDPQAELFKSVRQKARFTRQLGRLENYLKANVETHLFLCQNYLSDEEVIRAAGRKEAVNIGEFKTAERSDFRIKLQPVSNDYNSMFGKQIELETIAQYFGKDMPMDMKAALIKNFPFLNKEPVLQELMLQYESPTNMILALDRGEQYVASQYDDFATMLKRLYIRIRSADFKTLKPEIQENYMRVISEYEQLEAKQQEEAFRKQQGFWPTSGNLVKVDMYEMDQNGKQVRATFPNDALMKLREVLTAQGMAQDRLAEIANQQGENNVLGQIAPDAFPNQDVNQQPIQGGM